MAIPSATIVLSTYNVSTGNNALVTFTFSEAVSGFALGDISAPNGTLDALVTTDNIVFTSTFTPAAGVLDNSNVITITAGSYTSVSTSGAGLAATSSNYTVNTVTMSVPIATLTDTTVGGTGVFDQMMKAVNAHVHEEWSKKRITSEAYPQVYLGAMQTALTQAVLFTMQRPMVERQAATEEAKKLLIERQTKGFDDDAKQKLLKQSLDTWSVAYSVAKDANSIPDSIKVDAIDQIMKSAMSTLGVLPAVPHTFADGSVLDVNPLGIAGAVAASTTATATAPLGVNTTADTTPTITVLGLDPAATVSLYVDNVLVASTYNAVTGALTPTVALALGLHYLAYTTTIAPAAESAKSTPVPITITGTIAALASPTSFFAPTTTSKRPIIVIGTSGPALTNPKLYVDDVFVASTINTASYIGTNGVSWTSLQPNADLALGAHTFVYTLSDASNIETGRSTALTITIT